MMFSNESTENLLDNLENELSEAIGFDNPTKVLTVVEIETEKMPPIAARRNFASFEDLTEIQTHPVAAARKLQTMDKKEKNDENEIIQLSSISSSSASENVKNYSQNTVVRVNEKKGSKKVVVLQEHEKVPDEETFFVVKHGKWAQDEEKVSEERKIEKKETKISESLKIPSPVVRNVLSKLEVVSETPKKTPVKKASLSSCTSSTKTSVDSSSEASSSSSEESVKVKKKSKKRVKEKQKKKSKQKASSEEPASSTETKTEEEVKVEIQQAIGKIYCKSLKKIGKNSSF